MLETFKEEQERFKLAFTKIIERTQSSIKSAVDLTAKDRDDKEDSCSNDLEILLIEK